MEEIFELNRVVGSYRVIRVLGSGGMGVVYEAEHLELKVRRALKVFAVGGEHDALHRKRFLSEGKMLAALDHARVVRVHEFDVDAVSGRPYFVMDLVLSPDGRPRTLEDERIAGVEESRAAALFRDLCEDQPTGRRGKWDEVRLGGIGETDCAIGARILRLSARGGAFLDLGRRVCACA